MVRLVVEFAERVVSCSVCFFEQQTLHVLSKFSTVISVALVIIIFCSPLYNYHPPFRHSQEVPTAFVVPDFWFLILLLSDKIS